MKHARFKDPAWFVSTERIPNYFWFVTLRLDIEPPPYAGWILIDDMLTISGRPALHVKKKAPRLHVSKWSYEQIARIARPLSFRLLKVYEHE